VRDEDGKIKYGSRKQCKKEKDNFLCNKNPKRVFRRFLVVTVMYFWMISRPSDHIPMNDTMLYGIINLSKPMVT
jgi:hypothetical protein